MKLNIIKVFLFIVFFGGIGTWYFYRNVYPLSEFQRLGQFQFPMGTSVETWSENDNSLSGIFNIDSTQSDAFINTMSLKTRTVEGKDVYSVDRCYNEGKNRLVIDFDPKTARVKIRIETPDPAGAIPCG